jgi:hypothetical protein
MQQTTLMASLSTVTRLTITITTITMNITIGTSD